MFARVAIQISNYSPVKAILRQVLTVTNELLLYNQRIVVPVSLQQETLSKLHWPSRNLAVQTESSILSMLAKTIRPIANLKGAMRCYVPT